MRVACLSDLHVDDSPGGLVARSVAEAVLRVEADALIVAGDISGSWPLTLDTVAYLEGRLGRPVLFVPGNHDLWTKCQAGQTSEAIHRRLAEHPSCLSGRVVRLGEHAFVGETGWYDGSLAEGRFTVEEIERMEYGGRVWQDSLYARWEVPMAEKAAEFESSLRRSLDGLDPGRTVVVTHALPRLEFTVQPPDGAWTYFNGLLGSSRYGSLFAERRVRAAVCGHVHYRRRFSADGVEWICACLGTPDEWRTGEIESEIADALEVLEL